jgi:hypothetical protein
MLAEYNLSPFRENYQDLHEYPTSLGNITSFTYAIETIKFYYLSSQNQILNVGTVCIYNPIKLSCRCLSVVNANNCKTKREIKNALDVISSGLFLKISSGKLIRHEQKCITH